MGEGDSGGRRGGRASKRRKRETVQKMHEDRECVCFPVQEQCGKGAQAGDGHSANSIMLLVAKFKTRRLDYECYNQDLIFILSL